VDIIRLCIISTALDVMKTYVALLWPLHTAVKLNVSLHLSQVAFDKLHWTDSKFLLVLR